MNEEEGELRPQIADRFGLTVTVNALHEPEARAEIMRRREAFAADPAGFRDTWSAAQAALAAELATAERLLPEVRLPEALYAAVAQLVIKSGVASHRADLVILACSKGLAALAGRREATTEDVLEAALLALGHRLPVDPFAPPPAAEPHLIRRLLDDALEVERSKKASPDPVT
jgi:magnesium chelatase subunit D